MSFLLHKNRILALELEPLPIFCSLLTPHVLIHLRKFYASTRLYAWTFVHPYHRRTAIYYLQSRSGYCYVKSAHNKQIKKKQNVRYWPKADVREIP